MSNPKPTNRELSILRVLWSRSGPATVREVHARLLKKERIAYTTVLKMLTIMSDKGLVHREETERSHKYKAVHEEPMVQTSLMKDLLDRAFSGSALALLQRALDDEVASNEDLESISKMIAEAKARRTNER
jgi:BlaI family transcriptional regulator, penicillinase repressor